MSPTAHKTLLVPPQPGVLIELCPPDTGRRGGGPPIPPQSPRSRPCVPLLTAERDVTLTLTRDARNLRVVTPGRNSSPCLLYTSDAADERSSVDLGGRRIIKKKINL